MGSEINNWTDFNAVTHESRFRSSDGGKCQGRTLDLKEWDDSRRRKKKRK